MNLTKTIICTIFVFVCALSYGQKQPYLSTKEIKNCTIKGTIANKYPITLQLNFKCFSDYVIGYYSIAGYYYYDKYKTKIALSGVYSNKLSLYNFTLVDKDAVLLQKVLLECYFPDTLTNLIGYNEMFLFENNSKGKGLWKNEDKELSVSLDIEDNNIFEDQTYLHFSNGKHCNLTNHFWSETTYEYICSNADESIVVLKFRKPENAFIHGICGAENEEGIYVLSFNKAKELVNHKKYLLSSCPKNINYTTLSPYKPNEVQFGIVHWDWEIDKKWVIVIDKNNCEVNVDSTALFEYPVNF